MRWSFALIVLALAAPACFLELPDLPVDSATSSSSEATSSDGATTGSDASADPATSESAGSTTSGDADTTGETTTAGPPAPEGLFACEAAEPCAAWTLPDCAGACTLDAAGSCVLDQLRLRDAVSLRTRACAGPCAVEVLLVRGQGTAELRRQRADLGPDEVLVNYQPPMLCELRPPEFFAACLEAFTAECADPAQWTDGCVAAPAGACL
ncbi:MAG: hypothetical protein IPK80_05160 [Nannocystis sp.]|nr:hypothetical protein [Nannocystis sp.]